MRISVGQRQQNEARIWAAIDRLLAGDIPPGGKRDIKTLAREAAVDRAAFYGTRPYARPREEFEARLQARRQATSPTPATPRSPASRTRPPRSGSGWPTATPRSPRSTTSGTRHSPGLPPSTTRSSASAPRTSAPPQSASSRHTGQRHAADTPHPPHRRGRGAGARGVAPAWPRRRADHAGAVCARDRGSGHAVGRRMAGAHRRMARGLGSR
jgi:hypothetical protein